MVEMNTKNRYLVRIMSYDMINRSSSIIREWTSSNLSESWNADYVDFCIDSLAVDWTRDKIYFSEETRSSGQGGEQVDYIKLVSCGFDGQNLTAVKKFDRLGSSSYNSLVPIISQIHITGGTIPVIRASLSYSNSMGSTARNKIFTFDFNGNDLVVPIDNEGQGGAGSEYIIYPIESFASFTLSESGDEIYFVTYDQDSYNTQIVEPSITKMTDQGYDKENFVDLSSLLQRPDLWDYWSNERS